MSSAVVAAIAWMGFSVLCVVTVAVVWVVARLRRQQPTRVDYTCACGHSLAFHEKPTGSCSQTREIQLRNSINARSGTKHVVCACEQYVGELPPEYLMQFWDSNATPIDKDRLNRLEGHRDH